MTANAIILAEGREDSNPDADRVRAANCGPRDFKHLEQIEIDPASFWSREAARRGQCGSGYRDPLDRALRPFMFQYCLPGAVR